MYNNNLSHFVNEDTANTKLEIAVQRSLFLKKLNCSNVLELCVGPSLKALNKAYNRQNISVTGNDIESRWLDYFPSGNWIIGDCFTILWANYEAVVFAPPLSKNCSGNREDSLKIDEVYPSYYKFIDLWKQRNLNKIGVCVLPARSLSTKQDRFQYFKLLNYLYSQNINFQILELKSSKRNIRKYIDIYMFRNELMI